MLWYLDTIAQPNNSILDDVNTWFWAHAIFHLYISPAISRVWISWQRVLRFDCIFPHFDNFHPSNSIHLQKPQLNENNFIEVYQQRAHKRENEITSGFHFNRRLRLSYGPLAIQTNEFSLWLAVCMCAIFSFCQWMCTCYERSKAVYKLFITINIWFTNKSDPFVETKLRNNKRLHR